MNAHPLNKMVPFRDRRILQNIRFYVRRGMAYTLGGEELNNFLRYVTIAEHPADLVVNTDHEHPIATFVEMTVTTPTRNYPIFNGYNLNVEHPNNVTVSQIECRFVIRYTPTEINFQVFDPDEELDHGDNI
ncbi:hypothetical protein DERF_010117 [Dermatophagoides farinae]|uniref:Uncharacterized protein n=2 Tax=Dermatophagoides farinae TaxID=6954 RepID=A0A922HYN0_DERFA|nr:hypothetical protein DERF_010117 [Dermatophagoides farinae]